MVGWISGVGTLEMVMRLWFNVSCVLDLTQCLALSGFICWFGVYCWHFQFAHSLAFVYVIRTFNVSHFEYFFQSEVLQGDLFLNEDLNQLIKRHCGEVATHLPLDFAKYLKTSLR